ncbi:pilus assembly protein [Duganella sp. FT27W]|uniref:pilus assembly protein n=1 Tax=Duganella sp. FT27W TaxID=2654636 RepID=UPI00128CF5C9|nr:pilus assembly protein [Duganella sp. FT27W]MPQ57245.1 pilus assembly protein [Duganella sp. FT27W]
MARLFFSATLGAMLVLGGCSMSPQVDRQFGDSVRQAQAQQTLNLHAGDNRSPVNGMDGKAAESVYENYQKSFRAPEAQSSSLGAGLSTR